MAILGSLLLIAVFYSLWAAYLLLIATNPSEEHLKVDFLSYYSGSEFALDGDPAAAYDAERIYEHQIKIHGDEGGSYAWLYPPPFFFFVLPLALLPVTAALAAWFLVTGGLLAAAVRRISSDAAVLVLAIAFPATFLNFVSGQNGLLTAALLAWGVLLLRDRPVLAAVVLGLLVYKPQFFPLIPVALIAGGHRSAAVTSVAAAGALLLASIPVFGLDAWEGFFSVASDRSELIYAGGGDLHKMQSVTGFLLVLGTPAILTQVAQAGLGLACAAFVVWLWRKDIVLEYKAAGLALAILLASPYSYHYDLTLIGLAGVWLYLRFQREGWKPFDAEVLVLAFVSPVLTMLAGRFIGITFGPFVLLILLAIVARRANQSEAIADSAPAGTPVPV